MAFSNDVSGKACPRTIEVAHGFGWPQENLSHADLIRDKLAEHESQRADVEHLLGQSFPASFRQRNPATAIRSIEELVDYPKKVMDWLADATGKQPLSPGQGLDVARQVARQMQSLKLFTNLRLLTKALRRRANLRRINHQSGI